MRFGIILPIQAAGVGLQQLLAELRAEVAAADRAGFDAFFLPEFHSVRGAGGLISPAVLGAALAEGTSRIKVGQAVLAAPLHHPVRVAEDIAMLSWLTEGRALLGVGSAHMPTDFDLYGVHRPDRYRLLRELLDVVRAAWSGERFSLHGYEGRVSPRPYGDTDPEIWMGAHGPAGLTLAGRQTDVWISDPQRHVDVVADLATRYRAAAANAGRPARVAMFRDGWIDDSRSTCAQVWLPHALAVHRLYFNVGVYRPEFEPWVSDIASRDDFTADRVAPGRFLYGTGADIRAELGDWRARTGCSYVAIRMRQPGGPGHERTMEAIDRFGHEVIGPLSRVDASVGM